VIGSTFFELLRDRRALARQHALTLVTRDAHFTGVRGLVVERWER
jgi:hypothetical protein